MNKSWVIFFLVVVIPGVAPCVGADHVEHFEPPPIQSKGDAAFGKPPVRPQSLAEVQAEIVTIGKRGTWKLNKRWEVIINSLQATEVPVLLDTISALTPSDAKESLRIALYSRWAEMDPQAAMRRIEKEPDNVTRGACLQALFEGWAHANASELNEWAQPLAPGGVKLMAYMAATPYMTANEDRKETEALATAGSEMRPSDPRLALQEAAKIPERERRLAFYKTIAKEWAAREPAAAMQWAVELPISSEREPLTELVANTWSRIDPEQALTFLLPRPEVSRYLIERIVSYWAGRDFPAVIRWGRRLADPKRRNEVLQPLISQWADRSPDEVMEFVQTLPKESGEFYNAASKLVSQWSESAPDRLFALLDRLTPEVASRFFSQELMQKVVHSSPERLIRFLDAQPPGRRADSYGSALLAIAAVNPAKAKEYLAALSAKADGEAIRLSVLRRFAQTDLPLALELYATIPAGQSQLEALNAIVSYWGNSDPAKALAWLHSLPLSPATQNSAVQLIRQFGQSNPQAALAEMESWPLSQSRQATTGDIVATWATRDFAAASQYIKTLSNAEMRNAVKITVAQRMAGMNGETTAKGLELLLEDEMTPTRMGIVQQSGSMWARANPAAALKWAEQQTNVEVREEILLACLYPLSQTSLTQAAAALDRFTLPQNQQRAVEIVAQAWTSLDPGAAGRWAAAQPSRPIRRRAITAVLNYWVGADYAAAAEWAVSLPSEDLTDSMWGTMVQAAFGKQPSAGLRLAAQIKEPKIRDALVLRYFSSWLQQNRSAAEAWLADSGLPPDLVEKLRQAPAAYR